MVNYHYPILSYFLQAYWNQNSDIMYGTAQAAALDFVALENEEFCNKLLMELSLAMTEGLIQKNLDLENCHSWWLQYDAVLSAKEACEILGVIEHKAGTRSTN